MTWTLHEGDCLDPATGLASLPDLSIDVAILDPPYSEHVHSKNMRGSSGWKGIAVERDLGFPAITTEQIAGVSKQLGRLVRRWAAVFSDTESAHLWAAAMEASGLEYIRTAFWRKVAGAPQFTGDRPAVACEAITLCHRPGKKRWNGGGKQGFYECGIVGLGRGADTDRRVHTTQKPLDLMEALVRDFTDPGETVLDCFMGSGTTGVACRRLGRSFVGWERDPKYAAVARRRIESAREQVELFAARTPKPKQTGLDLGLP